MTEREDRETIVELLLLEPEIVAWLGAYNANDDDEADDDEPPRAA